MQLPPSTTDRLQAAEPARQEGQINMKEFSTKEFAAELKREGYTISTRTLEDWRLPRNGKLMPDHYDERKRAVYTEAQLEVARALLSRNKKTAPPPPSLFDETNTKETINMDNIMDKNTVNNESISELPPVEENHGDAQIDTPATVEASNDQTPADSEHDATNEDSNPVDDQHEETPATVTEPIIDEEFKNLIAPLSDTEFSQLEASVTLFGILDPLKTWNGILIDGHHRYQLARKHGLTFKTTELQFDSREDVIVWIGENQMARRNLNRFARGELALKLESSIAARAKANLVTHTADGYQPLANLPNAESINTRDKLAKIAGVSSRTLGTIKYLVDNATEEIKTALRNDTFTINAAYEAVKAGAVTADDVINFKAQKKTPAPKTPTVNKTQEAEQPARTPVEEPTAEPTNKTIPHEDSDAEKLVVGNYFLKGIVNEGDGDEHENTGDDATQNELPAAKDNKPVTNEPPKDDSESPAQIGNEPQGKTLTTFDQLRDNALKLSKKISALTLTVANEALPTVLEFLEATVDQLRDLQKEKSPATTAGKKGRELTNE